MASAEVVLGRGAVDAEADHGAPRSSGPPVEAGPWRRVAGELGRDRGVRVCLAVLGAVTVVALFPDTVLRLYPHLSDPFDCSLHRSLLPPSADAWFGHDLQGCDHLARTVHGARNSVAVAVTVLAFTLGLGLVAGLLAGWRGGWVDAVLSRATDMVLGIPMILGSLVFLSGRSQRGVLAISFAISLFAWPQVARLVRGSVLEVRTLEYVDAARALGADDLYVLRHHVLPNAIGPVLAVVPLMAVSFLVVEAVLSWLGIGFQLPAISWGLQINTGRHRILHAPHILVFPTLAIATTGTALAWLGEATRRALDPEEQAR